MRGRLAPALMIAAVLLAPGCRIEDVDLTGRPCPCAVGWTCDPATNRCVRVLSHDASTDDAARDAPPADVAVQDAPPAADAPAPDAPAGDAGTPGVAVACRAAGAVTVDGRDTEWAGVPGFLIPHTNSVTSVEPATSDQDCSAGVRVMWDDENLYVLVQVSDEALQHDSSEVYDDDAVELFLDGGHERASTYDSNDYQLTVDIADHLGGHGSGALTFARAVSTGTGGYAVEYAVPFTSLAIAPAADAVLGFDVAVDDDDDGGLRDTFLTWHGQGNGWQDPREFGELRLSAAACGQ